MTLVTNSEVRDLECVTETDSFLEPLLGSIRDEREDFEGNLNTPVLSLNYASPMSCLPKAFQEHLGVALAQA